MISVTLTLWRCSLDGSPHSSEVNERSYPLLYEMLRSFTVLARTLNLSHTVLELGSTRQTVRRHIATLEEAIGQPLFMIEDRSYSLTEEGSQLIPAARDIIERGQLFLNGGLKNIDGMPLLSARTPEGWEYHQQQLPLSEIWASGSELHKAALKAWTLSEGNLEHKALKPLRPYLVVYRDSAEDWVCVEIGEHSFYAKWWGWRKAKSSIGRPLGKFPGGAGVAALLDAPYREIFQDHGVRLDQVVTKVPRTEDGDPVVNVFDRLLLGSRFPDGSFALISVVDRSETVRVEGADASILEEMPEDATVDFVVS